MKTSDFKFLAIDPGTVKCGLAVMDSTGQIIETFVSPFGGFSASVSDVIKRNKEVDRIIVGAGTGSREALNVIKSIQGAPPRVETVQEKNTTLNARKLYEKRNPRPWPLRLIPFGLFGLPEDMDAYAAAAIGLNYLEMEAGRTEP